MRPWARKGGASFALACLVIVMLPTVSANPMVPYCGAASLGGGLSAAGAAVSPEACEASTGRVFPEAIVDPDYLGAGPRGFTCTDTSVNPTGACTGFATDYVGYFEFQAGLNYLASQYPDWIEVHEVAMSEGNKNQIGGPVRLPIYMLEISNEESPIPRNEKQNLLFMLSIHGNEKGGREGGFRVLEDLLRNIGFARETVHNGAGMPELLAKPTGGNIETYRDYLDFMNIFLLFPNSDGWSCDELEYGTPRDAVFIGLPGDGGGCQGTFRRGNGNGVDLNRQTPTLGWHNSNRDVAGQSEASGYLQWMHDQMTLPGFNWTYAIDIHGMLQHRNFGAIMLPAGSFSPQEMARSLSLADTLKEYWNQEAEGTNGNHFQEWATAFAAAEEAWGQATPAREPASEGIVQVCDVAGCADATDPLCDEFDCPVEGSALYGAAGTIGGAPASRQASSPQFAEYYTVIDAIGYTDSGFSGDYFAQTTGLNAPGYDIELAYNHMVAGAQYEAGALLNDYHVWMVRHIVKSFMDAGGLDVQISYDTKGTNTAYLIPQYVATNLDDVDEDGEPRLTPGGWADENPADDNWQYSGDQPFEARPARYWEDMEPFLCGSGCGTGSAIPGTLVGIQASGTTAEKFKTQLANFDNLVIPGTAINQLVAGEWGANEVANGTLDQAKVQAILDWIDAGGNLVLTDAGLKFLDLAGVTDDAVTFSQAYMGGIRMDLSHELLVKVRGGVKQTYEPTPLGFGTTRTAPNWGVDPEQFAAQGGSIAGRVCGGAQLTQSCNNAPVSLGYIPMGGGRIQVMGALLPDPTEEFYHPYGLDHYATTYSGNQIMRNMLGWDEVYTAPPLTITEGGKISQSLNEPEGGKQAKGGVEEAASAGKGSPLGLLVSLAAVAAALVLRRRR